MCVSSFSTITNVFSVSFINNAPVLINLSGKQLSLGGKGEFMLLVTDSLPLPTSAKTKRGAALRHVTYMSCHCQKRAIIILRRRRREVKRGGGERGREVGVMGREEKEIKMTWERRHG